MISTSFSVTFDRQECLSYLTAGADDQVVTANSFADVVKAVRRVCLKV